MPGGRGRPRPRLCPELQTQSAPRSRLGSDGSLPDIVAPASATPPANPHPPLAPAEYLGRSREPESALRLRARTPAPTPTQALVLPARGVSCPQRSFPALHRLVP